MESLSEDQIQRYARHIVLPEVGGRGQLHLLRTNVRVDLSNHPAAVCASSYLAAAGVGNLLLCGPVMRPVSDKDITLCIPYGKEDLGRPRLDALSARIAETNPDVVVREQHADDFIDAELQLSPAWNANISETLITGGRAALDVLTTLLARL